MAIPDYEDCMLPLLEVLADGQLWTMSQVTNGISDRFELSDEERQTMLPSGQQTYVSNRVAWAKTYLKHAGLLANPSRGKVRITEAGKQALSAKPPRIDRQYLKQYPGFVEFMQKSYAKKNKIPDTAHDDALEEVDSHTPLESLDQ